MPNRMAVPLCLAMAFAAAAEAQMISPMLYEGPRISLQDHAGRATRHRPENAPAAPDSRTSPSVDPRSFRYQPDRARREANLARFVAKSRAVDPQGAASLERLFAQGDIIERMRPELARHGLSVDDLADSYTVWWINAWQASRGLGGDASPAATASVRRQVMQSMASTPGFVDAGDAAKQSMAESLLVQSLLLAAAVEQARGKPAEMAAVRNAAVRGARAMGLDLTAMTLTDRGFVPIR